MTNGLPSNAWVTSLAMNPITPTVLYAGTWDGQVYCSTDGGDAWEGLGHLGYVHSVLVHPAAPSVIYAGTSNRGLFRGSVLHHLTIDPIPSPQFVGCTFPITLTARDELGFLFTDSYNGTATLADTTGTISPTLVAFVGGVATTDVVIAAPVSSGTIVATVPGGPSGVSNPFDVIGAGRVYLPLVLCQ